MNKENVKKGTIASEATNVANCSQKIMGGTTEELLHSILSTSPCGVYRVQVDSDEIVYANDNFFKLRGYSRTDARDKFGNKVYAMFPDSERASVSRIVAEALQEGSKNVTFVTRMQNKEGVWRYFKTSITFDNFQGRIMATCVDMDITKEQSLQEALHISNARLETVFKQTHFYLREYDYQTKTLTQIDFGNNAPYVENNIPEAFIDIGVIHPVSKDAYLELFNKLRRGDKEVTIIAKVKNRWDTAYNWVKITYANVFNEQHKPCKAIGIIENINATKEAMDKAEDINSYLNLVLADAIYTWTADLTANDMLKIDRTLCELAGVPDNCSYSDLMEAISAHLVELEWSSEFHDLTLRINLIRAYNDAHRTLSFTFQTRDIKGDLTWHMISISLTKSKVTGNICALFIVKDINLKKEYELSLKTLAERDTLTYLYNRHTFSELLEEVIKGRQKQKSNTVVLLLQISGFMELNESMGQAFGDDIIRQIAEHIVAFCSGDDLIGRIGVSAFAIELSNIHTSGDALKFANSLLKLFKLMFNKNLKTKSLNFGIGITELGQKRLEAEEIYAQLREAERVAHDIGRYQAMVYGQYIRKFDARSEVQEEYLANELDELIYVVNLRTYNLIYVNQAFKDYFHVQPGDYTRAKCYEVIHQSGTVCSFCPAKHINNVGFTCWTPAHKSRNNYIYKGKAISWYGMSAMLIVAMKMGDDYTLPQ